jgi:hypothetical protein
MYEICQYATVALPHIDVNTLMTCIHIVKMFSIDVALKLPSIMLQGFVPLYQSWESFYTRHVYRRIRDCFNRPISGVAGPIVDVLQRSSQDHWWTCEYVKQ